MARDGRGFVSKVIGWGLKSAGCVGETLATHQIVPRLKCYHVPLFLVFCSLRSIVVWYGHHSVVRLHLRTSFQKSWGRSSHDDVILPTSHDWSLEIPASVFHVSDSLVASSELKQYIQSSPLPIIICSKLRHFCASTMVLQASNLILVTSHAIWTGQGNGLNEAEWLIASFQKQETPTFIEHIKAGLSELSSTPESLLVFSGYPEGFSIITQSC